MMRDAQDTKRRILAAATEEFTKHGIAGARVDRIAAAANSNKAMLYAYFARLTHAPYKRYVEIGEGTHHVMLEKNRMQLFQEVQQFLDGSLKSGD